MRLRWNGQGIISKSSTRPFKAAYAAEGVKVSIYNSPTPVQLRRAAPYWWNHQKGVKEMKLGSLFDGSGTAPLAAAMCGIEPVWASEIEPYPRAVTKARFPGMQHLGDITKIDGRQIAWVDIICGGSPCQDLSVAGKQAGLQNGERSHLFFEMVRIIREMREASNGKYPKYIIWENVPGAFSSNAGRDFLAVLQSFAEIADPEVHVPEPPHKGKTDRLDWRPAGSIVGDGWSIAWRMVDAQFWGVPQRRRRIYLVMALCGVSGGDCGDEAVADTGIGRAGEILFERKGMRGHSETRGTSWKGTACDAKDGSGAGGREGKAIAFNGEAALGVLYASGFKAGNSEKAHGIGYQEEISPTLTAAPSGINQVLTAVIQLRTFDITGNTSNSMKSPNPTSCFSERDVALTLDTFVATPDCNQGGMVIASSIMAKCYDARGNGDGETVNTLTGDHNNRITDYSSVIVETAPIYCLDGDKMGKAERAGGSGLRISSGDSSYTLTAKDRHAVAYSVGNGQLNQISMSEQSNTLDCMHDKQSVLIDYGKIFYIVRRLTPTECARLQGFPDWWTDGVPGRDSAKYKMWGNGMALPNMLHVMRGIRRLENG